MTVSPADIKKIAEGFRGRFYMNGNRVATCTTWRVERTVNRDDIVILDDPMQYSKMGNVHYQLVFEDFTITHAIAVQMLADDAASTDSPYKFVGEEIRGDGAVATWVIEEAYSVDQTIIGQAAVGATRKGTFNFRLNARPVLTNPWG